MYSKTVVSLMLLTSFIVKSLLSSS